VGKAYKGFPRYLLMGITYREKKKMNTSNIEDEINHEVKQQLEKINSFAYSSLNQEYAATWLLLKALAKGEKSWSELEKEVNLGTSTLSRKLKKMQKQKIVKRKIIPAFPPRTAYEIDKENCPKFIDDLLWLSQNMLERAEKWTLADLALNINTQKMKKSKEFLRNHGQPVKQFEDTNFNNAEEALYYLFMELELNIYSLIRHMLSFSEFKVPSLWSTFFAMIIMQKLTALAKNLSITPEMEKEATSIIEREYDEKRKALQSLINEKRFAKIPPIKRPDSVSGIEPKSKND
jgi:DNA-binding HxlR family transcriptional regulator